MIALILAGTAVIAIALISVLAIVITGINGCERRADLASQPGTLADQIARHVLGTQPRTTREEEITHD
jgi:hypothetical protein